MTEEFQRSSPLGKDVEPLEVYAEHAEIRKQIYDEIRKLYHICSDSQCTIVDQFVNCITPLKNAHDPGRLPVYRTKPVSPCPVGICCVWAVVSRLVQAYWEYELNDEYANKGLVQMYLKGLREINEHYPEMKIAGAENKGYWLEL